MLHPQSSPPPTVDVPTVMSHIKPASVVGERPWAQDAQFVQRRTQDGAGNWGWAAGISVRDPNNPVERLFAEVFIDDLNISTENAQAVIEAALGEALRLLEVELRRRGILPGITASPEDVEKIQSAPDGRFSVLP